jgi:hypothetical protein
MITFSPSHSQDTTEPERSLSFFLTSAGTEVRPRVVMFVRETAIAQ